MNDEREDDELRARLAALPREVAPPRDLWRGVESRISELEERARSRARMLRTIYASVLVAAAASVAIAFGLGQRDAGERAIARGDSLAAAASSAAIAAERATPSDEDGVLAEEPSYRAAIAALRSSFAERRDSLPPESGVAVEQSLRVLDAAIADTRAALVEKPDDEDLRAELGDAYQLEIDVLDDVLDLPSRT